MKNKKEFEEKDAKEKELFFTKEKYESVKQKIEEYNKKMSAGNRLKDFFV